MKCTMAGTRAIFVSKRQKVNAAVRVVYIVVGVAKNTNIHHYQT